MRVSLVSICLTVAAANTIAAQEVRFPPPSFRAGEFRLDLRVRIHLDINGLDAPPEVEPDTFDFRRARVALEGRFYDDLEYEVDAELRDIERPWRDVFLNYRRFEAMEIRGGKFKVPFSLDQLTSTFSNAFISRSLIGSQLAPGREQGVMAHGQVARNRIRYRAGWFKGDGDTARFSEDLPENEFVDEAPIDSSLAGRIETTPWRRSSGLARHLQFGGNVTFGRIDEGGLFGLRGRTVGGFEFFRPVYVQGRRNRYGVDGRWTPGPLSVQAEYSRVVDQRNGQGLADVDLPDVIAEGWYLAGPWLLTGENRSGDVEPRRPLFQGGAGAIEVVARIEELRFSSAGTGGEPPFDNPRAANILPNRDRAVTLGVNWYVNKFGRVAWNAVRESIQDPVRSPLPDRTHWWTGILRLQFVL
jgi:phosphate-selective porin OprO/OprP